MPDSRPRRNGMENNWLSGLMRFSDSWQAVKSGATAKVKSPNGRGAGLTRIMHETPWRDRRDGGASGQPSRGTAGLDLRRTCSVRPKVSLSCLSRLSRVCRGELVAGSLSREHARTPGCRLRKTGRRRRQGDLRNKAHRSHYLLLDVRQASRTLSATRYKARPHPTLVRVQGVGRKAQGKKLIPDP